MGVKIKQEKGAGAPEVEDGITDAVFTGVIAESHPDWVGTGKFGYDDGERWRWMFTPLDASGAVMYGEDEKPIELKKLTTQTANSPRANAYQIVQALMTKPEFTAFTDEQEFDADDLVGRPCQIIVRHNDNGWPEVESITPPRKGMTAPVVEKTAAVEDSGEGEDDEEAALAKQIAAAKAKKAAAAKNTVGPTKAEQKAAVDAEAKAKRIADAKAALAALEEED